MSISIKTPDEIEKMRAAGKLAASVLEMIEPHIKAGVTITSLRTMLIQRRLTIMAFRSLCALRSTT